MLLHCRDKLYGALPRKHMGKQTLSESHFLYLSLALTYFFSSGYGSVVNLAAVSGLITQSLSCCHHDRKAKTRRAKKRVAESGHQDDLPRSLVLKKLTGEKDVMVPKKKTMGLSNSEKWPIFGTSKWPSGVGTPGPKFSDGGPIFFLGPGALTSAGLIASAVQSCRFWECRMGRFWHGGIRCKGLYPIRQRFFSEPNPNPQLWLGAWLPCSLSSFPSHCRAQHPGARMGFVGMRGSLGYFLSYESPGRDSWGQLEISLCPQVFWSLMVSKSSGHTQISEFSESQAGKTTKSSENPQNW